MASSHSVDYHFNDCYCPLTTIYLLDASVAELDELVHMSKVVLGTVLNRPGKQKIMKYILYFVIVLLLLLRWIN